MRRCLAVWGWGLLLFVLAGCEHRPLVDVSDVRYLRVYLDDEIRNVTMGFYCDECQKPVLRLPDVLRVGFYDEASGRMVKEGYLRHRGRDAQGEYLDGTMVLPSGRFRLRVYSFGTETSQVRGESDINTLEVYTGPIASYLYAGLPDLRSRQQEADVRYEPDHFFLLSQEDMQVRSVEQRDGQVSAVDTLRREDGTYFRASTVVESFYLQVGVKGVRYVSSAVAMLDGMAGSRWLGNREMNPSVPAMVYFTMLPAEDGEKGLVYATFNTFGKLPEPPSRLEVMFHFVKSDGSMQSEQIDLTPLFDTDEVKQHRWIILDREIVITPPVLSEGGDGFSPSVGDWEDLQQDLPL
ncbi:MAG: DUF5119 domain-containing protein [Bacteroidaceae bacterium]